MKKVLFIMLSILMMSGMVYLTDKKSGHQNSAIRIAIFEPATHPALDEIVQGFIETMAKSKRHYVFERFNANGNKILLRSLAEEILQDTFDLIFTVGVDCSLTIKNLSIKKQSLTPIVFTGVDDPQKLGLVGAMITGISTQSNYPKQISLLTELMPNIKNILLVYDPTQGSGLESDKEQIASILKEKNLKLTAVEIESISEITQKMISHIDKTDVVMVLKDNTAVSGIDSIIELCNRRRKPLFASDLNSGMKGAALTYGIREYDSGAEAALKAQLILEHAKNPSEIAVSSIETPKMLINKKAASVQGLDVDLQKISELTSIELY